MCFRLGMCINLLFLIYVYKPMMIISYFKKFIYSFRTCNTYLSMCIYYF